MPRPAAIPGSPAPENTCTTDGHNCPSCWPCPPLPAHPVAGRAGPEPKPWEPLKGLQASRALLP
eukprot:2225526-Heterocapsa_arctica.AAC.1